jgi:hypothetical protein
LNAQNGSNSFFKHFAQANPRAVEGEYVFISDREKVLPAALKAIFPNTFQSHIVSIVAATLSRDIVSSVQLFSRNVQS